MQLRPASNCQLGAASPLLLSSTSPLPTPTSGLIKICHHCRSLGSCGETLPRGRGASHCAASRSSESMKASLLEAKDKDFLS
ncbi:hypothetical protein EI94DRAFT_1731301 [Lactarius quietus]|nr:hypothetical protein EI94DRAFT_1731301 [Lactarius quietus]